MTGVESRQVSWYETFRYAATFAAEHGIDLLHDGLPLPGTPHWCGLPDDDARKLLALLFGGVREAICHDARQAALADASHNISTMAPWARIGRGRGNAYIPRKAS